MDSARERVRKALDALVYLPVDDVVAPRASKKEASRPGERPACRVWDRGDLLRRLQSYKANTWFCKPPGASPLDCARRGWVNTSLDMLTCEFCAAKLHLPIPMDLPPEEVKKIGEGFGERLISSHDAMCPWRTVACDPGLAAFPPLERRAVCDMYAQRQATLSRLDVLPPISEDAYRVLESSRRTRLHELLLHGPQQLPPRLGNGQQENGSEALHKENSGRPVVLAGYQRGTEAASRGQGSEEHIRRQRLLALTGWSAEALKPDQAQGADVSTVQATAAVLRCAMCDARVGLWNLVPEMAIVRQGGTSNHAAGLRGVAAPVALASVDLSRTIAGGELLRQGSLPKPPGPFGLPTQAAPVFGVPNTTARPPQQEGTPQDRSAPGPSLAMEPFGSAAAAVPVFGAPPVRTAGQVQQADTTSSRDAGVSSVARAEAQEQLGLSSGTQQLHGPFGSSAGPFQAVFGIEALKANAAASAAMKRLHEDLSSQEEDMSRGRSKRERVDSTGILAVDRSAGADREINGSVAALHSSSLPEQSREQIKTSPQLKLPAPKSQATSSMQRRNNFSPLKPGAFDPFDPLQSHRAFCPWVSKGGTQQQPGSSAGQTEGRVGWRWCLDSLIPVTGPEEEAGSGQPVDQRTKLLALLRNLG